MDIPERYTSPSAGETQKFGEKIGREWKKCFDEKGTPRVICLYGALGSGKTTFVQGIASGLGIVDRLLSPTFVITRLYPITDRLQFAHVDLYRLTGEEEIYSAGIPEMLMDPSTFLCIEWAERLGKFLPQSRIDMKWSNESDVHQVETKIYE